MDKAVQYLIDKEYQRQSHELEMIASENYVSTAVMQTYANVYTNKYSEGYPGKRYYGGQKWVDINERLCQWRALKIYGLLEEDEPDVTESEGRKLLREQLKKADRAVNVQPLSGSPANLAVYLGVLKTGDTILGMDLDAGGHLTHGHPLNASGTYYTIVSYGVDANTHRIDYDEVREKALASKPQLILLGFSAYPRTIDYAEFAKIADAVEAEHGYRPLLMMDMAHIAGLIAGGVSPSPFPHMDIVTTTTHKTLRGPRGGMIYMKKGTLQRNGQEINLEKAINRGVFPGSQGGPHEHIIASKTVAFGEILYGTTDDSFAQKESFSDYAQRVVTNCQALAQGLMDLGWTLVSEGTDNHLIQLDVTKKSGEAINMTGKEAEKRLEEVGISVNKNMLPFDPRPPMDPSGVRVGTPAVTSRGLGIEEMKTLATCIDQALTAESDEQLDNVKKTIRTLCEEFPLWY